jgi:hypothetical protein
MQQETLIEFRPLDTWFGEYGFDWMRVYEGGFTTHFKAWLSADWNFDFLRDDEIPYIDGASDAVTAYPRPPHTMRGTPADGSRYRPLGVPGTGIVAGGFVGYSILMELSPAKAQEAIQKEYESFEIPRPGTLSYRLKTYFVPWLNLFPAPDAGRSPAPAPGAPSLGTAFPPPPRPGVPPPPPAPPFQPPPRLCEAELQVLYDIKNALPQKIVIEFDKNFIEIDGNTTGKYELTPVPSSPTLPNYLTNVMRHPKNIKIKCIKEINDPRGSTVVVRAIDLNAPSGDPGTLAGKLIVCPNSRTYQREIKIILVRVITDIDPLVGVTTGAFDSREVAQLFNSLHQALLRPDIVDLDETGRRYELDLSAEPEFRNPGLYSVASPAPAGSTPGQFVIPPPASSSLPDWQITTGRGKLHRFLVRTFNANRTNNGLPPITDRYFLFAFDNPGERFTGVADGNFVDEETYVPPGHPGNPSTAFGPKILATRIYWRPSTAVFKNRSHDVSAHEMLHALTLRHTHRDWVTPPPAPPSYNTSAPAEFSYLQPNSMMSSGCRFLFHFKTTTNIMSYNDMLAPTTWHWQWEIMRNNAGIAPHYWTRGKAE